MDEQSTILAPFILCMYDGFTWGSGHKHIKWPGRQEGNILEKLAKLFATALL